MNSTEFTPNAVAEAQRDIQEGYWQDAVKKAEADREARRGKPFERNPASHDKHGVYVGDKDLAGDPVPKRKQSDVSEAGYDFNKPYGVKYKVFGSRDGRIVTKEFWASTPEKLEKAVAKIEALDNFYEIDGYHNPRPDQQQSVAEDIDRENPIVKEYYALMKNDIKTLRNLLKQQTKIIDTSEYTTKDHAISAYLHNKHGSGRVNAAFGLDEQGVAEAAPKKKAPLAKELNFHGYTIRVSNKPNAEKQFTGIAFLPGKGGAVRQERFVGASGEEVESKAKNWVLSFNERRTWDNIKDSRVTVDFNSEFIKNYRQGNDNFWSKFTMLDNNTPAFLIAPDSAEDEFGVEILRGEGYSKASPKKIATSGEIGNTSVTNIAKVRAVKAGLIPNGRYTLEKSNKKTKSLGSDIFTLAYHSTVDAPNAPMRLSDPGVTIAANRKVGEASDKRPKYVVTTKDKPKKVKPSMGGESPHPYQGKMVGEQQKHSSAYSKGFSDGVYGQRDPRASSYGPGVDDYDAGFAAGLEHEKQQKQQRATKYQSDIAPYMSMTVAELEAEQQQIKKQRDAIFDMAKRGKLSAEQKQKYRELGDQFQIIHQAKFQKQQNPDMQESSKKKDACYNKVKSRYKIWPSAYASGALVKCRKVGADNWGNN